MLPPIDLLNRLLLESGHPALEPGASAKFALFLNLLQRWNARTNLTAIRDEQEIIRRHFLESILCAHALPKNLTSLLDFGSGAGFPGIPISLTLLDLRVTLAESQHKKAAFLREAVRTLELDVAPRVSIHSGRAQDLKPGFDCVTLRAVDRMDRAIPSAIQLLNPKGWLAVLTTNTEIATIKAQAPTLAWNPPLPLPPGSERILLLGQDRP